VILRGLACSDFGRVNSRLPGSICATICVRFTFGFKNKKAPSRPAWGVVEKPGVNQRHDRRSTKRF
jgi:hypothetical protein